MFLELLAHLSPHSNDLHFYLLIIIIFFFNMHKIWIRPEQHGIRVINRKQIEQCRNLQQSNVFDLSKATAETIGGGRGGVDGRRVKRGSLQQTRYLCIVRNFEKKNLKKLRLTVVHIVHVEHRVSNIICNFVISHVIIVGLRNAVFVVFACSCGT